MLSNEAGMQDYRDTHRKGRNGLESPMIRLEGSDVEI